MQSLRKPAYESSMSFNSDSKWTCARLNEGNTDAIKQRARTEPNYLHRVDSLGHTPLRSAIDYRKADLVQVLIECGADINHDAGDGYTCLHAAIEEDGPAAAEIVKMLISAGADLTVPGINGWSPLHLAAARGRVDAIELLLGAGAPIDQTNELEDRETPLMNAAFAGQAGAVELLLQHGADPTARTLTSGQTALDMACAVAEGPDPMTTEALRQALPAGQIETLVAQIPDDIDPDLRNLIKGCIELDPDELAQTYVESSQRLLDEGDHETTIRLLSEHQA